MKISPYNQNDNENNENRYYEFTDEIEVEEIDNDRADAETNVHDTAVNENSITEDNNPNYNNDITENPRPKLEISDCINKFFELGFDPNLIYTPENLPNIRQELCNDINQCVEKHIKNWELMFKKMSTENHTYKTVLCELIRNGHLPNIFNDRMVK